MAGETSYKGGGQMMEAKHEYFEENCKNEVLDFLRDIFSDTDGYIEIRAITKKEGYENKQFFTKDISKIDFEELYELNQDGYNIYFGVCTRKEKKGTKFSVLEVPALWVDLDSKDYDSDMEKLEIHLQQKISEMGIEPSHIIASGHGFHIYFQLSEQKIITSDQDINDLESYITGLRNFFGGDAVQDLSRVLRLPGFANVKDEEDPVMCRLVKSDSSIKYDLSIFDSYKSTENKNVLKSDIDLGDIPKELPEKFNNLLKSNEIVRKTWNKNRDNLSDTSASGHDMALINLLHREGYTPEETAAVLMNAPYDKHDGRSPSYLAHSISKVFDTQKHGAEDDDHNSINRSNDLASRIIELIENSDMYLFHDSTEKPYAKIYMNGNKIIIGLRDQKFKSWVCRKVWESEKKPVRDDIFKSVLNILEAKAVFEGNEHELHNRVANKAPYIYIDLGGALAVKIKAKDWKVLRNPSVSFQSYSHQKDQCKPKKVNKGFIYKIFDYVNVQDNNEQLLFIANLVCSFIPDIPHPIDVFHGDQGSAKTTSLKVKKELVDPSILSSVCFPTKKEELLQAAAHHWYLMFDNISELPKGISDILCRIVTGEGFSKRELYSDDRDVIYSFRRCIGINGINLVPENPDLLERCLIFECKSISPDKRIDEKIFWEKFKRDKPKLLGSLFELISDVLDIYPTVTLTNKPRMADFAIYGCAVAKALGMTESDFMSAYESNIKIQNQVSIESNPISSVLMTFMSNKKNWTGPATKLLKELDPVAVKMNIDKSNKNYPKDPRWVWRKLKVVKPNLAALGYEVSKDDSDHSKGRKITIYNSNIK
jgi:hypothetical protein